MFAGHLSLKFIPAIVLIVFGSSILPAISAQKARPDVNRDILNACNAGLTVCLAACGPPPKGTADTCGNKCSNIWARCEKSVSARKKNKGATGVGSNNEPLSTGQ
jgi:hypothetical protein